MASKMAEDLIDRLKKYKTYLNTHPNGEKVLPVLRKLASLPVSVNLLQESGIGKAINGFRKRDGNVGIYASILVNTWKDLVRKAVRTTVHKHESTAGSPSSCSNVDNRSCGIDEQHSQGAVSTEVPGCDGDSADRVSDGFSATLIASKKRGSGHRCGSEACDGRIVTVDSKRELDVSRLHAKQKHEDGCKALHGRCRSLGNTQQRSLNGPLEGIQEEQCILNAKHRKYAAGAFSDHFHGDMGGTDEHTDEDWSAFNGHCVTSNLHDSNSLYYSADTVQCLQPVDVVAKDFNGDTGDSKSPECQSLGHFSKANIHLDVAAASQPGKKSAKAEVQLKSQLSVKRNSEDMSHFKEKPIQRSEQSALNEANSSSGKAAILKAQCHLHSKHSAKRDVDSMTLAKQYLEQMNETEVHSKTQRCHVSEATVGKKVHPRAQSFKPVEKSVKDRVHLKTQDHSTIKHLIEYKPEGEMQSSEEHDFNHYVKGAYGNCEMLRLHGHHDQKDLASDGDFDAFDKNKSGDSGYSTTSYTLVHCHPSGSGQSTDHIHNSSEVSEILVGSQVRETAIMHNPEQNRNDPAQYTNDYLLARSTKDKGEFITIQQHCLGKSPDDYGDYIDSHLNDSVIEYHPSAIESKAAVCHQPVLAVRSEYTEGTLERIPEQNCATNTSASSVGRCAGDDVEGGEAAAVGRGATICQRAAHQSRHAGVHGESKSGHQANAGCIQPRAGSRHSHTGKHRRKPEKRDSSVKSSRAPGVGRPDTSPFGVGSPVSIESSQHAKTRVKRRRHRSSEPSQHEPSLIRGKGNKADKKSSGSAPFGHIPSIDSGTCDSPSFSDTSTAIGSRGGASMKRGERAAHSISPSSNDSDDDARRRCRRDCGRSANFLPKTARIVELREKLPAGGRLTKTKPPCVGVVTTVKRKLGKSRNRIQPADARALLEDSLFADPFDCSIKVPVRQRTLELSASKSSCPAEINGSAAKSAESGLAGVADVAQVEPGEGHFRKAQRCKSSGGRAKSTRSTCVEIGDAGGRTTEAAAAFTVSHVTQLSAVDVSPEGGSGRSFEDFMTYDNDNVVKRMLAERSRRPNKSMKTDSLTYSGTGVCNALCQDYKRWPVAPSYNELQSRNYVQTDDAAGAMTKCVTRTQVFAGSSKRKMDTLFNLCTDALIKNIDCIENVGAIPYLVLKGVIDRASPQQLYTLEYYNPHFLEDTDHLWRFHCRQDFPLAKPEEMECWREVYEREFHNREVKYQRLKDNMMKVVTKGQAGRKVRMAYMETAAKPPREVLRQQQRHGTAGIVQARDPVSNLTSYASFSSSLKHKGYIPLKPQTAFPEHRRDTSCHRLPAPLMQRVRRMARRGQF